MTTLLNLEHKFQNYLLDSSQDIFHHVMGTTKVPTDIRRAIYGHAYQARLHEALVASYPVLEQYLGSDPFEELSYAFIEHHPSNYRSIRWFGDTLAEFIQEQSQYREYIYLSELAAFEWTLALVFDAACHDILELKDMQHVPPNAWANMRLRVHPSIHRLSLSWNVVQLWQTINDNSPMIEPCKSPSNVAWILWRKDLTTHFSSLPVDEAFAIDAIIKGSTFGEVCEGLCQWVNEEDAGIRAASLLKGWITAGLITEIVL